MYWSVSGIEWCDREKWMVDGEVWNVGTHFNIFRIIREDCIDAGWTTHCGNCDIDIYGQPEFLLHEVDQFNTMRSQTSPGTYTLLQTH